MNGPRDFFVTYNGKDERYATWIAATLEAAGYTTVIQAWDFRPGDNFLAAMDRALEQHVFQALTRVLGEDHPKRSSPSRITP
jgi:hypothetical protein